MVCIGTSLAFQWLRLCASTAGGAGSIPGQGTKILHAVQSNTKKKKKCIYGLHCLRNSYFNIGKDTTKYLLD